MSAKSGGCTNADRNRAHETRQWAIAAGEIRGPAQLELPVHDQKSFILQSLLLFWAEVCCSPGNHDAGRLVA